MTRDDEPRLTPAERALIERAERAAVAALTSDVDARLHAVHEVVRSRLVSRQRSRLVEARPPRRPFRWPRILVPVLVIGLVVAVFALITFPGGSGRSGVAQAACRGDSELILVNPARGQCVGLTGTDGLLFGDDDRVRSLQSEIFAENEAAQAQWTRHPGHPIVTFVYLTSFTLPHPENFVAEREGLQGIRYAQHRANQTAADDMTSPYVQILVANAGAEGAYADLAVARILDRFRADRRIVAVVATVDSRAPTVAALEKLNEAGLPVISPTMSADPLGRTLPLFLPLDATNSTQAELVHDYATRVLKRTGLVNYFTFGAQGIKAQETDLYVDSLRDDLRRRFGRAGYREQFWSGGESLAAACRTGSVVFFGGRYTEFGAFLGQIGRDCAGRMPGVVADGSVARFMANSGDRRAAPPGANVSFVSGGYLGTCGVIGRNPALRDYLSEARDDCDSDPAGQVAGWSALTYDAAMLLVRSVRENIAPVRTPGEDAAATWSAGPWRDGLIRPVSLYRTIRSWPTYDGVTGPISVGGTGRYAAMVCARDVRQAYRTPTDTPRLVASVGTGYGTDPRPSGEPCSG